MAAIELLENRKIQGVSEYDNRREDERSICRPCGIPRHSHQLHRRYLQSLMKLIRTTWRLKVGSEVSGTLPRCHPISYFSEGILLDVTTLTELKAISSPWDVCLARSLDQAQDANENLLLVAMAGSHQIWGIFLSDGKWLKGCSYSKGTVVRLAGSGAEENRNTSYPARAGFAQPSGLAVGTHSGSSVLYIADSESSSIRRMSLADGAVKAVVGAARDPLDLFAYGDVDGIGIDAKLQHPLAVATVGDCVYLADSYNHKVSYQ
nr:NHL repeat-containing protein 2-like [Cherax quadricarinatus]